MSTYIYAYIIAECDIPNTDGEKNFKENWEWLHLRNLNKNVKAIATTGAYTYNGFHFKNPYCTSALEPALLTYWY